MSDTRNPTPTSGALTFNPTPSTLTTYPTFDVSLAPSLLDDIVADEGKERTIMYILLSVIGATLLIVSFFAHRYGLVKWRGSSNTSGVNVAIDETGTRQMPQALYNSSNGAHDCGNNSNESTGCEISVDATSIETTKTFLYDIEPNAPILSSSDICFTNHEEASDNIVEATAIMVEQDNYIGASLNEKTEFFKQLDNENKFSSKEAYNEFKQMFQEEGITEFREFLLCDNEFYEKIFGLLKTIPAKRFRECFLSS